MPTQEYIDKKMAEQKARSELSKKEFGSGQWTGTKEEFLQKVNKIEKEIKLPAQQFKSGYGTPSKTQPKTSATEQPEQEQMVSMSPQAAYQKGIISRNEYQEAEKAYMVYSIPEKMLLAAKEAKKAYPVESLPETHSSLSMAERERQHETGMEEQKQDIIRAEAATPLAKSLYAVSEGGLGVGVLLSLAESSLTGKSFDVWQQEEQGKIEAFTSRGYKAAEKGWTDETWLWSISETLPASAAMGMMMFPEAGTLAFAGFNIAQGAETIKNPSQENIVRSFLYAGTALFAKSAEVMGGSMLKAYGEWKAPKIEPQAKGFSLKGAELLESKPLPEDTGLIAMRSTFEDTALKTTGNIFMITEDVGKISRPRLETHDIAFNAVTKLTKENVAETTITFGEVSRTGMKPFEKMTGAGKIKTMFNEKFEVDISKGDFLSLGRTGQQTLYGKELPKVELGSVKSIGKKVGEFREFDLMEVTQAKNQPTATDVSNRLVRIDTLLKGMKGKDMFEIDWVKAGDVKLSKSGLSAFQEKLKTQPFESLPKWPDKEWGKAPGIPENWPEINLLKMENMAKLQKGFDEALKSFVSGMTKNKPGVKVKDIGELDTRLSGGLGKGFMKKLSRAEVPEVEPGETYNVRPGDIKGMEMPELKDVPELRLGRIVGVGHAMKSDIESRQAQKQIERLGMKTRLDVGKESGLKEELLMVQATEQKTKIGLDVLTGLKEDVATLLGMQTKQEQKQTEKLGLRTRLNEVPNIPKPNIEEPPSMGHGFTLSMKAKKGKHRRMKLTSGFNVLIRRMGRWFELLDRPVSRSQAMGFGSKYALETPGASFKLVRAGVSVEDVDDPTWKRVRYMFRKPVPRSRLGQDTMIERNRFRIDMPEERRGITEKGIEASRLARMNKGKFPKLNAKMPKFKEPDFRMGKMGGTKELLFGKERKRKGKERKKKRRSVWDWGNGY